MNGAERLDGHPPSVKLVYKILEHNDNLTQKQIIEESKLSSRTVRDAINTLLDVGVVESRINPYDARQELYSVVEDHTSANSDRSTEQTA